jgi:hypothetical protein
MIATTARLSALVMLSAGSDFYTELIFFTRASRSTNYEERGFTFA